MDCRECKGRGVVLIDCDHDDVAGDSCDKCDYNGIVLAV